MPTKPKAPPSVTVTFDRIDHDHDPIPLHVADEQSVHASITHHICEELGYSEADIVFLDASRGYASIGRRTIGRFTIRENRPA